MNELKRYRLCHKHAIRLMESMCDVVQESKAESEEIGLSHEAAAMRAKEDLLSHAGGLLVDQYRQWSVAFDKVFAEVVDMHPEYIDEEKFNEVLETYRVARSQLDTVDELLSATHSE